MRTMTQRTTLPFLIAESGAASFTLAVITSPRPARSPRSPPRGRMHWSLRAPLLSATSRIVRIPIIDVFPFYPCKSRAGSLLRVLRLRSLRCGLERRISQDLRFHPNLHRAPDHFSECPPLQLAQRPVLHNAHHVADLGRAVFIVSVELLLLRDDPLVNRVWDATRHFDDDGLG